MADLNTLPSPDQVLVEQHDRLVKLTTPLGENVLIPQRVLADDRLARGYEYWLDCLSVVHDIELKKLIAQPVTLWVRQQDRNYLPVHGYVHTMKRLGSDGQLTFYQLAFAPWLHFLKYRKDARIWQDKTADDILRDVFNVHPQAQGNFRFDVREPARRRSYCTQCDTDWHFAQRLMEEEGWYSYHEQLPDGSGHVLVITDSAFELKPIAQEEIHFHSGDTEDELNKITHWRADRGMAANQLTITTDDYKAPSVSKQSNTVVRAEHGDLPAQLEIYEYAGAYSYSRQEHGDKLARLRVEQWESCMKRYFAVSGVRSLPVGRYFTFEDHRVHQADAPEDRQFLVIAVEWCIENNLPLSDTLANFPGSLLAQLNAAKASMGRDMAREHTGHCFNRMEVQRRKVPFRSPFEHTKPVLHPQTAIVVGPANEEIYTDHLNRVKVQFRWDRQNPGDERASCWVRVSYPNAGQGWGGVNVPRVGQEVIVTFLNGDADRPVISGRLYNEEQAPQWRTDGRLSGYKSKEYKGSGFNQLVLDDTTKQNRVHLYSTSAHAQLTLGYLVSQQGNTRGAFYGSGFALSTDDFGAVVTQKGLYLSTFGRAGPQGTQLDATEATTQLKAAASLTKNLSDTASKAGAEALLGQDALNQFIDATQERYEGDGQGGANRFKEPILVAASAAGIGLASTKGTHVHAGAEVTLSSGTDINVATGKSLLASIAEKISLFAYNAGIKLFAAKGKVEVQAQSDDLDLIAEKVVRLLSTTSRIEIHAKEEVTISAGGSFIKINASGITNGTPGTWTAQASMHTMPGPTNKSYLMPHVPKSELQKTDVEFRHLTDWGAPLAGAAYKATLSDGSVRKGILDALGVARISDVPPGAGAKIEYDYKPLQASSTVSTELDDDIHELLNWTPRGAKKEGQV
ncbi:type VI secretion system secreted protein VgrG [Duganella sp. CF517]|uniref:type VI secretion system Vgr family protein n=1 Tax=Duganella sp. CF517 TaxID=1881038 RepID=UPI0008D45892|nr:type VI secretion system Vgr family protein [Duganella sp. CF517]SEO39835.1 type VI secretion system secreted protein VgrG [Duganella sp. CF517]